MLLNLVRFVVMDVEPRRKFFLFEDKPDFFLAMEIEKDKKCLFSKKKIKFYKEIAPSFIKKLWVIKNTTDAENGEFFLNVMNLHADALLENLDTPLQHLTHCILNQLGMNREQESRWHYSLFRERCICGIKGSNKKKKIYKGVQR